VIILLFFFAAGVFWISMLGVKDIRVPPARELAARQVDRDIKGGKE